MQQEEKNINQKLELSCAEFTCVLDAGALVTGQFTIHAKDYIFGDIYSSDTRVRNIQKHFEANSTIDVEINGKNLRKGEEIIGVFSIISNVGEYTLPFSVKVLIPVLTSSQGEVINLFHFTNLAKENWQEAVELFYNPNFISIFTKKDQQLLSTYRGLCKQPGNENNVEEFLVAVNKKLPIDYHLDTDGVILENVYSSIHEYIHVKKSYWGYTDLSVETTGNFFTISHTHIGNDDFENNMCTLDLFINASKLSPGMNLGFVRVFDSKTELKIPVRISMDSNEKKKAEKTEDGMEFQLEIMDAYMNSKHVNADVNLLYTKAKKQVEEWIEEDEEAVLPQLYKIQLLLVQERFNEAKWLLDEVGHKLKKSNIDISTKCYYYFLTTLFNRDEEYIQNVINAFENALYKDKTQWRIAILLLNINEEYAKNPEKKWAFLKEQYDNGCKSPLLYNEALNVIIDDTSILLKLDAFEQQVIWYGIKKGKITDNLQSQIMYLAGKTNSFSVMLFGIMQDIYDRNPSVQMLTAICRLLIMNCKNDKQYFKWYKLGVERGIRVTGLYEYYMYSLNTSVPFEIPRLLLLYFSYQSQLEADKKAVLYRYVIENADIEPELANTYAPQIERFVIDEIREGKISEDLAFLYENVVTAGMLRDDLAYLFTPILFTHKIVIDNPNITSIVLIQDRMKGESIYPVENGECMLPVYSEDYAVFLQDSKGNRFAKSVSFRNTQMMEYETLLTEISPCLEGRASFDFYQCEKDRISINVNKYNVERIRRLVDSDMIIDSLKTEFRTKLLHFYYDDDRIGELDNYLDEIDDEELETSERAEFMRFLITRGKFDKAYIWLKKYGALGVNQKNIARLVSKRIQSSEYMEEEFLINVAFYVFKKAKYDEATLLYLIKYYNGKIRDLRDIWLAGIDLKLDTKELMERMLRQMLITNEIVASKNDILLAYEETQEHDEALVEQYYENISHDYLIKDVLVENKVLERLYQRLLKKDDSQVQKLAFLKFLSEEKGSKIEIDKDKIESMILDFYKENKYFAFFKQLSGYSEKLHFMRDRYYIEYHTLESCDRVKIHYVYGESASLEGVDIDDESYKSDEMIKMFEGIYVKECTLFAGEILQYYISEEKDAKETITYSYSIHCEPEEELGQEGRYSKLNDMVVSMELTDDKTAKNLLRDYLFEDYCARDFFRTI